MKNIVKTIDWMLAHTGLAVAKVINNNKNTVEIIKYSENWEEYPTLKSFAKANDYVLLVGKNTEEENKLGYLRN